jgi:hypothetical protein
VDRAEKLRKFREKNLEAEMESEARRISARPKDELDFSEGLEYSPKFDYEAGYTRNVQAISGKAVKGKKKGK